MATMLETCGLSYDDLRELYQREKSVKRMANYLRVSTITVSKWLRLAGVETLGHRPPIKPTTSFVGEYGPIAQWIKEHPGQKLPRRLKDIATLIGVSPYAVSQYFYRRKRRILRYIRSFGDLRAMRLVLTTTDGRNVRTSLLDSYEYDFNRATYEVVVRMKIQSATFIARYPLKVFLKTLRELGQLEQSL